MSCGKVSLWSTASNHSFISPYQKGQPLATHDFQANYKLALLNAVPEFRHCGVDQEFYSNVTATDKRLCPAHPDCLSMTGMGTSQNSLTGNPWCEVCVSTGQRAAGQLPTALDYQSLRAEGWFLGFHRASQYSCEHNGGCSPEGKQPPVVNPIIGMTTIILEARGKAFWILLKPANAVCHYMLKRRCWLMYNYQMELSWLYGCQ